MNIKILDDHTRFNSLQIAIAKTGVKTTRRCGLKGQCKVYEAMQVSLFNCIINMLCYIMSCNVTNHAMHLIGLL